MQTVEDDNRVHAVTARNAWANIISKVGTPEGHACVISARRTVAQEDPERLVAEYRRLRKAGTYAELNTLPLTAGHLADLAVVVNGGKAGVNAHRLDGHARQHLAARQLIAVRPGSRFPAADWRATVHATLRGIAVVRAAQGRPVQLTTVEAMPLAMIERAMHGADGGSTSWPGSDLALRIAQMWRLVEYTRVAPPPGEARVPTLGKTIYRLTPEGRNALERHRQASRGGGGHQADFGPHAAEVLGFVAGLRNGDPGATPPRPMVLQQCIDRGWLVEGTRIPGTDRIRLALTDTGRELLSEWKFRQQAAEGARNLPTVKVTELTPGMWVRLANRRPFPGLGAQWVRVHDVRHVQRSNGERLAHNYEVWVISDAVTVPYLYGGRALFRTVAFQRRHL